MTSIAPHWDAASTKHRMKALLALRGWALEDLSKASGITKQAWSKALAPRSRLTPSQFVRFAKALSVSYDDLICTADFVDVEVVASVPTLAKYTEADVVDGLRDALKQIARMDVGDCGAIAQRALIISEAANGLPTEDLASPLNRGRRKDRRKRIDDE